MFDQPISHQCSEFVRNILDHADDTNIDTVVLTGRFPQYYWGTRFNNGEGGIEQGSPTVMDDERLSKSRWDSEERKERVLTLYEQRIQELSERFNVVLVAPIPEAGWNVPEHVAKQLLFSDTYPKDVSTSFDRYKERANPILKVFQQVADRADNVVIAPVHEALCSPETNRCINIDGRKILYYDDDHLSKAGARMVAPIIINAVESLTNP